MPRIKAYKRFKRGEKRDGRTEFWINWICRTLESALSFGHFSKSAHKFHPKNSPPPFSSEET